MTGHVVAPRPWQTTTIGTDFGRLGIRKRQEP